MKRITLIVIFLACTLSLPLSAFANETVLPADSLQVATDTAAPLTFGNAETSNTLFNQLIAQEVSYRLDGDSTLKFSCNVAALSGSDLDRLQEQVASATPDFQVELVVRF